MINDSNRSIRHLLIVGLSVAATSLPVAASADVVVRVEGPRPPRDDASAYPIEIEPHFSFGPENVYGVAGIGAGLRVGVPLVRGSLGAAPDNLAVTFGADVLHYENCFYGNDCGANYLMAPVAAQWNVFVARRVSLFAEAGAFLYKGWFNGCGPGDGPACSAPRDFGLLPTLAIGGRLHFDNATAFTLRLGYPTTTFGLSFM
jgi:hypothetical protein